MMAPVKTIQYTVDDQGDGLVVMALRSGDEIMASMTSQKLLYYGYPIVGVMADLDVVPDVQVKLEPNGQLKQAAVVRDQLIMDDPIVAIVKDAWNEWREERWQPRTISADRYYST